jgi:hypothetical protein
MTKQDIHKCDEDCEPEPKTYSDDNCVCYGQVIAQKCPRHGRNKK